ncbi:ABC transporter permease [Streptomyces zhihengii]
MQNAFVEATYPVHEATRPRGAYPAAAATPLSPGDILTGHLMFIAFRIAVSALAFVLVLLAFGVTGPATGALLLPCVLLVGMAFAAPLCAWAVGVERPSRLNGAYRFVAMPLYLFSGTFFAVGQLPGWLQWAVTLTPLYHGTELVRGVALGTAPAGPAAARRLPRRPRPRGHRPRPPRLRTPPAPLKGTPCPPAPGVARPVRTRRARGAQSGRLPAQLALAARGDLRAGALPALTRRGHRSTRRRGAGTAAGPGGYAAFVAPALLATAAMNGAMDETTFNLYAKLRTLRTYDAILSTPLSVRDIAFGEVLWALLRGTAVTVVFAAALAAFGMVTSPWALLVLPGATRRLRLRVPRSGGGHLRAELA